MKKEPINNSEIKQVSIVNEMKSAFIDYAMSVIVSRALPDVRDGLKPVHRRILYAMYGLELFHNKSFKKSARTVGEVIAKYHPHGDSSVYDAMVRMAQPFSLRYPLIWGQGNFGSIDGDSAAAMRYTESKLKKITNLLLKDLKADTVDFQENYDGSEKEPVVLPSLLPNLLLNGSTGIAVGMSTSIPPHNLQEVFNAIIALASNPELSENELLNFIKGPDFPTGGTIINSSELTELYRSGNGRIILRGKTKIIYDEIKDRSHIIINEIPYMVNKANLIIKIAELVKQKVINSISEIRDESNRKGIRIVLKLKRGFVPEVELNRLFKYTPLQNNFPVNMLALKDNKPEVLSLKAILINYLAHQYTILLRKTKFFLTKAQRRQHILEGIAIAINEIDKTIKIIKTSQNNPAAINHLRNTFNLSEKQAKAILEMKLQRLTNFEQKNLQQEIEKLTLEISEYYAIIGSKERQTSELIQQFKTIKNQFQDERKTEIATTDLAVINDESLIPNENVVITLTKNGYVKRINFDEYRLQKRGGKGAKGITINDDDIVNKILTANTHSDLLFFTNLGKVYKLRCHQIPKQGKHAKGQPAINLIPIDKQQNEKISALISVDSYEKYDFFFITRNGTVKKTAGVEYQRINRTGKKAIVLANNNLLIGVKLTEKDQEQDVLIAKNNGKAIRFNLKNIRKTARVTAGVRGISTRDNSYVVDYALVEADKLVLSISELGFGKLTELNQYRVQQRGGIGNYTINIKKAGNLIGIRSVTPNEQLVAITNRGTSIKTAIKQISQVSRHTKGVKIISPRELEKIVSITTFKDVEEQIE